MKSIRAFVAYLPVGLNYYLKMDQPEIFEPFDKLIEISICGKIALVPENNTILRGLQFLHMESVSDSELCWNGECLDCQVVIKVGDKEKAVMACRTQVVEGMEIVKIAEGIDLSE